MVKIILPKTIGNRGAGQDPTGYYGPEVGERQEITGENGE
jgi:hypothetical protein